MIEFDKTPNLIRIIEEEKQKHFKPPFYSGEFDLKALQENSDSVTDAIRKKAKELEEDSELYLICELAEKWVRDHASVELWHCTIPLHPRTKKNHQQIIYDKKTHRPKVIQGPLYRQYETDCGWFIKPPEKPICGPVNIKCVFYRVDAKRCDLTNLLEAIDDILVKYKVIKDDCFAVLAAHDGSRVVVDRDNPRTEITITSMEVQDYGR